jgi:hypothetical protein
MSRTIQCDADVLLVLQQATAQADRILLPARQLERTLYTKVNRVLEELGGAWNRKAKAHLFTTDPQAALAQVLAQGTVTVQPTAQQVYQEFWTPVWLADQIVSEAGIRPGEDVCEPNAGTGRLIEAVVRVPGFLDNRESSLIAYEIQPHLVDALRQKGWPRFVVWCEDWLEQCLPTHEEPLLYDAIVMNPPWTKGQDIAHVTHALGWLKDGGRLVAVMPESIQWHRGSRAECFRSLLDIWNATLTPLPDDTFKESGANVKSVLVKCVRPHKTGMHQRDVMTGLVAAIQGQNNEDGHAQKTAMEAALQRPQTPAVPQAEPSVRASEQLMLF